MKYCSRDIAIIVMLLCCCIFLPAGYSNTGKKPEAALDRIRSLLGYSTTQHDQTHEKLLGRMTWIDINAQQGFWLKILIDKFEMTDAPYQKIISAKIKHKNKRVWCFQMSMCLVLGNKWTKTSWTLWPRRKVARGISSLWKTSAYWEKCSTASSVSSSSHSAQNQTHYSTRYVSKWNQIYDFLFTRWQKCDNVRDSSGRHHRRPDVRWPESLHQALARQPHICKCNLFQLEEIG